MKTPGAALVATTGAGLAFCGRALSLGGALAAVVVGFPMLRAGSGWTGVLLTFFATSAALGRIAPPATATIVEKGNRRDAGQVLANGGVAAACASVWLLRPSRLLPVAATGALAAAAADTWATEIGQIVGSSPRSIATLRPVPRGTSGGVTIPGFLASVAGAAVVAGAAAAGALSSSTGVPSIIAAGITGSLLDSLLGATVQDGRRCPRCGLATERKRHEACDVATVHDRGIQGFDNDAVNLAATGAAAIAAAVLARRWP